MCRSIPPSATLCVAYSRADGFSLDGGRGNIQYPAPTRSSSQTAFPLTWFGRLSTVRQSKMKKSLVRVNPSGMSNRPRPLGSLVHWVLDPEAMVTSLVLLIGRDFAFCLTCTGSGCHQEFIGQGKHFSCQRQLVEGLSSYL